MTIEILLNNQATPLPEGATVAQALAQLLTSQSRTLSGEVKISASAARPSARP